MYLISLSCLKGSCDYYCQKSCAMHAAMCISENWRLAQTIRRIKSGGKPQKDLLELFIELKPSCSSAVIFETSRFSWWWSFLVAFSASDILTVSNFLRSIILASFHGSIHGLLAIHMANWRQINEATESTRVPALTRPSKTQLIPTRKRINYKIKEYNFAQVLCSRDIVEVNAWIEVITGSVITFI